MILNRKSAKRLNRPMTIDLNRIILESKGYVYCPNKKYDKFYTYFFIFGILSFIFFIMVGYTSFNKTNASDDNILTIQDKIRLERLEVCTEAYNNSSIEMKEIYGQGLIIRCASYMSLIYAYESSYGKSNRCLQDKNCYGLKGNGYDTPVGFLKFDTFKQGSEYFAKKYFKWHYKKKIDIFVGNWSTTDNETYKSFLKENYNEVYNELEELNNN